MIRNAIVSVMMSIAIFAFGCDDNASSRASSSSGDSANAASSEGGSVKKEGVSIERVGSDDISAPSGMQACQAIEHVYSAYRVKHLKYKVFEDFEPNEVVFDVSATLVLEKSLYQEIRISRNDDRFEDIMATYNISRDVLWEPTVGGSVATDTLRHVISKYELYREAHVPGQTVSVRGSFVASDTVEGWRFSNWGIRQLNFNPNLEGVTLEAAVKSAERSDRVAAPIGSLAFERFLKEVGGSTPDRHEEPQGELVPINDRQIKQIAENDAKMRALLERRSELERRLQKLDEMGVGSEHRQVRSLRASLDQINREIEQYARDY